MKISLRPFAKHKSVIISTVLVFLSLAWKLLDAVSNLEFLFQKLGMQESVANFLGTRAPDVAVIVTLGALVFSLLFQVNLDQPVEVGAQESQPAKPEERVIVDVTPEYLMKLRNEHADVQAKGLLAAFIGKWMRVSGTVSNVTDREYYWAVGVNLTTSRLMASAHFREKKWIDRISVLQLGDEITVRR